MQNQGSPVQILSPVIPNNWCPSGDWAAIFNSYQTLFLNNSTVSIPGLGEVTPQQIQQIQQNIQNLQNLLDALAINVKTGTVSVPASANTAIQITFPSAMPNATYQINIVLVTNLATLSYQCTWALVAGTQTTTGFQIAVVNSSANVTSLIWTVTDITST